VYNSLSRRAMPFKDAEDGGELLQQYRYGQKLNILGAGGDCSIVRLLLAIEERVS